MKMSKRILAVVCAVSVMMFGTLAVSASGSTPLPVAPGTSVAGLLASMGIQTQSTTASTTTDTTVATSAAGTVKTEALPATTTASAVAAAPSVLGLSAGQSVNTLASYNVHLTAGKLPADIKFNVAGVTANSNIKVLHQKADGTWESVPVVVSNGSVTATFTSLSPVVIVEVATSTTGASPKTGEF